MNPHQFPRVVASFCSSATEFLQIGNMHSDEPVTYLLSKMKLAVTSQQWQNTIPQEHQVPILFFSLTFGKLAQRSARTSDGWTAGQTKELGGTVTLSQPYFGLKDILGEAWTKAFKMSTIRRGGEAGAVLHSTERVIELTLHFLSVLHSAPLTYSTWYICTFFYRLFSSHIVGVFALKYL